MRVPTCRTMAVLVAVTLASAVRVRADVSKVAYLSRCDDYQVWVNGREQFVYKSAKNGSHGTHGIASMSFVGFDLSGAVEVLIRPSREVRSFEVRPYSAGVTGQLNDDTISFSVDRPQQLVVRINDSYDGVLVICANRPQTPPKPEDVEHYYGPGVHQIGIHKQLVSGDDVYIADGAIVEGSFAIEHAENVTIRGRGIIACGRYPHKEDFQVIRGVDTKNVLIEGVTICNAPGWIISFWAGSENLTVRNVKTIGSWLMNSDGVQTGTVGLLVEDCFLQCNDDNFSLNGQCRDVEIRNCVLWNIYNGGVFMLGWGCKHLENIDIHDCVVFRAGGCCSYDRKAPFSMKLFHRNGIVRDIRFRNIVVEDVAPYGRWIDFQMNQAATVEDIAFEDISILRMWETAGELNGHSAEHPIEDVSFKNVRIAGRLVEDASKAGLSLINTRDIQVQGRLATPWVAPTVAEAPAPAEAAPRPAAVPSGKNLLSNPSFEEGLGDWAVHGPGQCQVEIIEDPARTGQKAVRVFERASSQTGIVRDITSLLKEQGPGRYTYSAHVRTAAGSLPVAIGLRITDGDETFFHPAPSADAGPDGWSRTQRSHDVAWSDLVGAWLYIESGWGRTGDYFVDDCSLVR